MDRLRSLELFVRVVELRSFSKAAGALRVPRATVTAAVQELEAHVGVRLLHRTTRSVSPTVDGQAYHDEVLRILRELSAADAALGRANRSPSGRIRVDVPAAAGRHVLAPALPAFLAAHPELTVELGSSDRPVDLLAEGVDCVIRGGDLHDESLVVRRLGELPVLTCAAPTYLAEHGTPATPDDLRRHEFVGFFSARTGRVFEVGAGGEEWAPRHRVAANDADTWTALAVAGLGVLQTPVSKSIRERVADGALVPLLLDHPGEPLPLVVAWPANRHLAARVRVFVDWVQGVYREEVAEAERFIRELREATSAP